MIDQLVPILIFILVIGLIWTLLKFTLKITVKVFSCGCVVILAIGLLVYALGLVDLPSFFQ